MITEDDASLMKNLETFDTFGAVDYHDDDDLGPHDTTTMSSIFDDNDDDLTTTFKKRNLFSMNAEKRKPEARLADLTLSEYFKRVLMVAKPVSILPGK